MQACVCFIMLLHCTCAMMRSKTELYIVIYDQPVQSMHHRYMMKAMFRTVLTISEHFCLTQMKKRKRHKMRLEIDAYRMKKMRIQL